MQPVESYTPASVPTILTLTLTTLGSEILSRHRLPLFRTENLPTPQLALLHINSPMILELGITLIQYGFAMRGRAEDWGKQEEVDGWGWQSNQQGAEPVPTFATAAEAEDYYEKLAANGTAWPSSVPVTVEGSNLFGDATTEWLSFFLMTVGTYALRPIYCLHILMLP